MIDQFGREIDYLRISITDRCNLRCIYCMPNGIDCVDMKEILTFEEMIKIVKESVKLGIKYIKITGGEPLVRKHCCKLIKMIKEVEGIEKVTITTNGILLDQYLDDLMEAKVDGINISLDTLNQKLYKKITGSDQVNHIIHIIERLQDTNIPVKINAVSLDLLSLGKKNGLVVDEQDYFSLIELTRKYKIDVRFIEMMPIGEGIHFQTINHQYLLETIQKKYPGLKEDYQKHGQGPAIYYHIPGCKGSIGLISAIHGKFCSSCNRVRLTSTGYLKPCLCYDIGIDLKKKIRNQEDILDDLKEMIYRKPKAHCFEDETKITEKHQMSSIGG